MLRLSHCSSETLGMHYAFGIWEHKVFYLYLVWMLIGFTADLEFLFLPTSIVVNRFLGYFVCLFKHLHRFCHHNQLARVYRYRLGFGSNIGFLATFKLIVYLSFDGCRKWQKTYAKKISNINTLRSSSLELRYYKRVPHDYSSTTKESILCTYRLISAYIEHLSKLNHMSFWLQLRECGKNKTISDVFGAARFGKNERLKERKKDEDKGYTENRWAADDSELPIQR